jgi:hypothetical protein
MIPPIGHQGKPPDFLSDLAVPELQKGPQNQSKHRDDPEEHLRVARPVVRSSPIWKRGAGVARTIRVWEVA